MSTEHPESGQPAGQLSADGKWRWDGHNWVPAQQPQQPAYAQQSYSPQQGQPQFGPPQHGQPQYGQPQHGQPYYGPPQYGGGMPPGGVQPKKGLPTWAKVLITLLVLFFGLIALLTIVGLAAADDYSDWSCEDVAKEALTIDSDKSETLSLTDVTALEITEDNRENFSAPEGRRGVVLSCEGTGEWTDLGEARVSVVLEASEDGDQWVRYEMVD